jgi:tRNA(Ile)-lysidine synthase
VTAAAPRSATTRFLGDLAAIVGERATREARFGVAVSGGPDSLALLILAHDALGPRIAAATIDHRLRPESADEARYVADVCAGRGIAHTIMTPDTPITGNIQANARAARYRLLDRWRGANALDFVLTAHHADDQLETLVMRLNRSSGLAGLAGIRARNRTVVRPLLHWRREELGDILAEIALPFVDDPSNRDHRYDRARLRAALADADWLDAKALAKSAGLLGEADEALAWIVARELETALSRDGDAWVLAHADQPRAVWHRMLVTALPRAQPGITLGEPAYNRLWGAMQRGEKSSIGDLIVTALPGTPRRWRIAAAPARHGSPSPPAPLRADKADRDRS